MAKKSGRARTARRAADRDAVRLRKDIDRVYQAEQGGSPDRPIQLASASEVEPDAGSRRCPYCGARMRVTGHDATEHAGRRLRVASLTCDACRSTWSRWYALGPLLQ
jgi:hypothetical protein